jgi:homoserine kinase
MDAVTDAIRVEVPASTSNLGSGFDTLGLALHLHGTVRLERRTGAGLEAAGNSGGVSDALRALADEAWRHFFRRSRVARFGVRAIFDDVVPVGRGLGASAVARVGVLAGLDALARTRLTRGQLLRMAAELEGHPDNASPAIFGGFTVSGRVGKDWRCIRFDVHPRWRMVALIPGFEMPTGRARRLLPEQYPRSDAVHALNRAALITAAFARQDLALFLGLFDDRIHQPYRRALIPQLDRVIRAGERAGAAGGFLSGAGSAIICLTATGARRVARAMQQHLPESRVLILRPSRDGYRLKSETAQGSRPAPFPVPLGIDPATD